MRACCEITIEFFKNLGKNSSGHPHPNYFDLDEKIYPERVIDWLKSLKDRVQQQSKKEWSEEDIMRIDNLIAIIENRGYPDYVEYLKSLKERYTWKPSDEQIETLNEVIKEAVKMGGRLSKYSKELQCLESLCNDLKKNKR